MAGPVDAAPGFILLLDREYRILYLNREAGGGDPARAVGRSVFEFLPPESRDEVRRHFDRAAAGEPITYEVRALDLGGRPTWYHTRAAPLPPACRPAVVILFASDVTDRRRDEEFARAVVEHAPVGIRVFDPAGNEVRRNEAMRQMLAGVRRDRRRPVQPAGRPGGPGERGRGPVPPGAGRGGGHRPGGAAAARRGRGLRRLSRAGGPGVLPGPGRARRRPGGGRVLRRRHRAAADGARSCWRPRSWSPSGSWPAGWPTT